MKVRALAGVFSSLLILLCLVLFVPGTSEAEGQAPLSPWVVECIDCPQGVENMGGHALRFDALGNLHIAYGGEHLFYAHHDGTSWHTETVDPTYSVGTGASLALDAAGTPHIVYIALGEKQLRYARRDGAEWRIETIDYSINFSAPSLVLDAAGRPHVSYSDWNHGLKHAWHDGAGWRIKVVDGTVSAYAHPSIWSSSLALDASGHPHISYAQTTTPDGAWDLRYARYDGQQWHLETVYNGSSGGLETSLALDAVGRPHVLVVQAAPVGESDTLLYAWHDGTVWRVETVAAAEELTRPSLALDAAGHAHVAFHQGGYSLGGLRHGWREAGVWHIEVVPDYARVGFSISLALDPAGRPHISYLDLPDMYVRHLKHAWYDGAAWHSEHVTHDGWRGGTVSLAVDKTGRAHVAYEDTFQDHVVYAAVESGSWVTECVDVDDWTGSPSLALDAAGQPFVAYASQAGTVAGVRYAWRDAAGWHAETVAEGGWGARRPSLALGPLGQKYISFGADGNRLQLARHDGSAWQVDTVRVEDEPVWSTCLALDPEGRPHLAYLTVQYAYTLRYAWHDGSTWHFETLLPGREHAGVLGLVIDAAGRRHLLYSDGGDLWYAEREGSEWQAEQLPWSDMHGSLAVDAGGRPHLSLADWGSVYHAWHDGTAWRREPAAAQHGSSNSAMAVDEEGVPHMAFSYEWFGGGRGHRLVYARRQSPLFYVAKDAYPRQGVSSGETVTYTLTLYGPGRQVELWDPLPGNSTYISGSITPPAVYSPTARAVLWHGVLPTATAQVVRFEVTAAFAGLEPLPIANTAWLTDTQGGAVSRALAVVNAYRVYLPVSWREHWTDW